MIQSVLECIQEKIDDAEMILVGLGEEWNDRRILQESAVYQKGHRLFSEKGLEWMEPAWCDFCRNELGSKTGQALQTLCGMLSDKNYFLVSTSTNTAIDRAGFREERVVMPCGSSLKKQCSSGCEQPVLPVSDTEANEGRKLFEELWHILEKISEEDYDTIDSNTFLILQTLATHLGRCDSCGETWKWNSVYTDDYKESGYLEQWSVYKKWLQGTVNRKLLLLELGVGLQFPTVIRFPFEKVAFYNQKSTFVRANEKLYQLTPELAPKGISIRENVVDCFAPLC